MPEIHTLDTVRLAVIDRDTLRMLNVILFAAIQEGVDVVTITSGSDGEHSGPGDPHHAGHAVDLRSHDFATRESKAAFVAALQALLGGRFYVFLEDPDLPNEHIHVQVSRHTAPDVVGVPV